MKTVRPPVDRTANRKGRRYLRIVGKLSAGLAILGIGTFGWLCWQIDRTGQSDERRPVDVIVVLGAGTNADGSPSQDIMERVQHGIELYHAGWAKAILFTGGNGPASASNQGRSMALASEILPSQAFAVEGTWETQSDASYSAALMRERGWQSALLVTHPLHCYRARRFFRQEGIEAYVSPTGPVSAVPQPWRTYYTVREALGVVWPYLDLPDWLTAWLQTKVYERE